VKRLTITVNKIELSTAGDFRGYGYELNVVMEKIISLDYGVYTIDEINKHLFLVIENLDLFQKTFNKGVSVIGDFGTQKVEIYDKKKRQEEIDDLYLNNNL